MWWPAECQLDSLPIMNMASLDSTMRILTLPAMWCDCRMGQGGSRYLISIFHKSLQCARGSPNLIVSNVVNPIKLLDFWVPDFRSRNKNQTLSVKVLDDRTGNRENIAQDNKINLDEHLPILLITYCPCPASICPAWPSCPVYGVHQLGSRSWSVPAHHHHHHTHPSCARLRCNVKVKSIFLREDFK